LHKSSLELLLLGSDELELLSVLLELELELPEGKELLEEEGELRLELELILDMRFEQKNGSRETEQA